MLLDSSTESTPVSPPTAQQAGTAQSPRPLSPAPVLHSPLSALTHDDVARIVAEQIALAFQALRAGDSQTPLILGRAGSE